MWLSEKPQTLLHCWWHDVTLRGWENKTRVKTEKLTLPEGLILPTPGSPAGNLVDIQRSNTFFFWVFHNRSWGPAAKNNDNKKLELETCKCYMLSKFHIYFDITISVLKDFRWSQHSLSLTFSNCRWITDEWINSNLVDVQRMLKGNSMLAKL